MKNIAFWSRDHKMAARLLIAVCQILIICLGCYVGIGLAKSAFFIFPAVFYIFTGLFITINLLFSTRYKSYSFNRKKMLDGLVLLCSFVMIISLSNQQNISRVTLYKSIIGSFDQKKVSNAEPAGRLSFKVARKQLKELRRIVKQERPSAGLVLLAVISGILLSLLVASVSCSLACDGQDGLAILVLLAGLPAIFFLCRAILRSNKKKLKQQNVETPAPATL